MSANSSYPHDVPTPRPLARYRVVLHKAAGNFGLLAVVQAVRALTKFGEAEAMTRMWQTQHAGRATLLTTHLERGELYVEQFAERGLHATLEPA